MSTPRASIVAGLIAILIVAPASAQVAVISIKSAEALRADARYLAKHLGQEKALDGLLSHVLGGKALTAIDGTKPLGLYVNWPRDVSKLEALEGPCVGLVPVRDETGFLRALGEPKAAAEGGIQRVANPILGECFVRFANGYAHLAAKQADLVGKLPEPAKVLPAGQKPLLVASLYTERFPKNHPELFDTLIKPLEHLLETSVGQFLAGPKAPGESDAQFQQRQTLKKQLKEMPKLAKLFAVGAVQQVRELSLNVDVDAKQDRLAVDVAVLPRPNSDLANFAKYAARARSRFAYLAGDADVSLLVNFPPPEKKGAPPPPDELPLAMRDLLGNPRYSELVVKAVQVVLPTIANDGLDACLMLSTGKDNEDAVLAAVKVQHGKKLDHLLRDASNLFPAEALGLTIGWNHAKHADARIHKFTFDDEENYLAIREDVIFFGNGKDGLKTVKRALDGFGPLPASTPLAQLEVSAAWLGIGKAAAPKQGNGNGRAKALRVTLTGGHELRLRVELNAHLLAQAASFIAD